MCPVLHYARLFWMTELKRRPLWADHDSMLALLLGLPPQQPAQLSRIVLRASPVREGKPVYSVDDALASLTTIALAVSSNQCTPSDLFEIDQLAEKLCLKHARGSAGGAARHGASGSVGRHLTTQDVERAGRLRRLNISAASQPQERLLNLSQSAALDTQPLRSWACSLLDADRRLAASSDVEMAAAASAGTATSSLASGGENSECSEAASRERRCSLM